MSDFFEELDQLMPLAREIVAKAKAIATRTEISVAARQVAITTMFSGLAEVARTLSPEGAAEKLLRDVGGPKPGGAR